MSVSRKRSKLTAQAKINKYKNEPGESSSGPAQAARRELAEAEIAEYVSRTVAAAPPLDDEQRSRLAVLLRPLIDGDVSLRVGAK